MILGLRSGTRSTTNFRFEGSEARAPASLKLVLATASLLPSSNKKDRPMNDILNPFDPASLRLDQTFTDGTAVKKLLTTIPVRKPNRQDFVRVHPDADYRLSPAAIIELKGRS